MNDDDSDRGARDYRRAGPFGSERRPGAADGLEKLFDALGGARASGRFERVMRDVSAWFEEGLDGRGTRDGAVHDGTSTGTGPARRQTPPGAGSGGFAADVDDDGGTAAAGRTSRTDDGYADEDGSASGSFRGRGPRNYRRTDERIAELVNDALQDDDAIDASDIEVSVADGDVTLSGSVRLRRLKHRAENVAVRAASVHDVDNRLRVKRERADGTSSTSPGGTPGEASRDADDYGHA